MTGTRKVAVSNYKLRVARAARAYQEQRRIGSSAAVEAARALLFSEISLDEASVNQGTVPPDRREQPIPEPGIDNETLLERTAQLLAHRGCCGSENDPANGKIHGYCVVCGVPWPCEYAGTPPAPEAK